MTLKKDQAIEDVLSDFERYANIVLEQLDLLEGILGADELKISEELMKKISENENELDLMEIKISDKIIRTIVLYNPVASDIRKLIACYRIIINLERIGDLVINITRSIGTITNREVYDSISDVISSTLIQSINMVKKSLLSYTHNDKEYAIWTIKNDSIVDEINQKLFKKAIKKSHISDETKQLFLSFVTIKDMVSSIERIADHATNIAEAAVYSFEGKDIRHQSLDEQS
jgi:phosphate transport system protein